MKKVFLLGALALLCGSAMAQESEGGKPLSMTPSYIGNMLPQKDVPQISLTAPDIDALISEDERIAQNPSKPVRIGACIASDISFPKSGMLVRQPDGKNIWFAKITVSGARALGIYYDKFKLPDGVKYFINNSNGKQVLGAYTSANNPDDGKWVTDKVQGEVMNLELDIDAGVDIDSIQLHINNVADYYKGIRYLQVYADLISNYSTNVANKTTNTLASWDSSSSCEINAICPIGNAYTIQRKATVAIQYLGTGLLLGYVLACTGTLMNNTKQDCTPYVLTATHVEASNSTSNTTFSQWQFYFLYETPSCAYAVSLGPPAGYRTLVGATFKARASYDSSSNSLVGDFLLLKLKGTLTTADSAYFAGWNIATTATAGTYTCFHHPEADVKKVSNTTSVSANGNFNGGGQNTHWQVNWLNGGVEEGSSGSGLFDPNGRLIGDLSGAPDPNACMGASGYTMTTTQAEYSKLTLNWSYVHQQPSDSTTRLKDWLDPTNSGVTILDAIPSGCLISSAVKSIVNKPANSFTLCPNPSNGITYADVNINEAGSMKIEVLSMLGRKVLETIYPNAQPGKYQIDLSDLLWEDF